MSGAYRNRAYTGRAYVGKQGAGAGSNPGSEVAEIPFANWVFASSFEGVNDATTFVDDSSYNRTPTFVGSTAKIKTAQKKFGNSSLYIPSNNSYVTIPHASSLNLTNQDFCVECYFYIESYAALENGAERRYTLLQKDIAASSRSWILRIRSNSGSTIDGVEFLYNTTGTMQSILVSKTLSLAIWYYAAVRRKGNTLIIQLNDELLYFSASFTGTFVNSTDSLRIGHANDSIYKFPLRGYIDGARISIGESGLVFPVMPYPTTYYL